MLGKVKTEQVKRLAKALIGRFPDKFSTNFDDNKQMVSQLTIGATSRVRNQVSGYITRTYAIAQADSSGGDEDLEEETE